MKNIVRLLTFAIGLMIGGILAYMLSSVFCLLRWPVFVIVCLFLGEIIYRIDKCISVHYKE